MINPNWRQLKRSPFGDRRAESNTYFVPHTVEHLLCSPHNGYPSLARNVGGPKAANATTPTDSVTDIANDPYREI